MKIFIWSSILWVLILDVVSSQDIYVELNQALRFNEPYCADSSFQFDYLNNNYMLYLSKSRPNLIVADSLVSLLINSIRYQNDSLTSFLVPVLAQLDNRYLSEYEFTIDNYRTTYHHVKSSNRGINLPRITMYTIIGKIERYLQFYRLMEQGPEVIFDVLMGRRPDELSLNKSFSKTWRSYGYIDVRRLQTFFKINRSKYKNLLFFEAKRDLSKGEAGQLIKLMGLWDNYPPSIINCHDLSKYIDSTTSPVLMKSIAKFNERWHKQECVKELLKQP